MGNQAVLEKAIRLAIDGGWNETGVMNLEFKHYDEDLRIIEWQYDIDGEYSLPLNNVIFSHEFAKALWGEGKTISVLKGIVPIFEGLDNSGEAMWDEDNEYEDVLAWQYHLQQMVIAEDPIKYLGENI